MRPRQRRLDNRPRQGTFRGLESFRLRIIFSFSVMLLAFGAIALRLLSVALIPMGEPDNFYRMAAAEPQPLRGNVITADGQLMATSLKVKSLFADPHNIMDIEEVAQKLPRVLPELTAEEIREDLSKNRRFVWLKRHLTPAQVYAVNSLGIPGLGFREETRRFYPQKDVAAHVLGSVNYRGVGIAGVEMGAEEQLVMGNDVRLTLDMRLQGLLHDTLEDTMAKTEAIGAWGVTLNAKTGEIMALVSLPDYDANHLGSSPKNTWLNRAVNGVYEMGSVFKLFTHAMAIEKKSMALDDKFDCTRPLSIGNFRIHDLYPKNTWLTAEEVFIHSSNIGAAQMGEMIGSDMQQAKLAQLGLFDRYNSGLGLNAATLAPDPHRWGRIQTMSVSYGHGMAVTALQMAAAARAVLVDGIWRQPTIIEGMEKMTPQEVFSPRTVAKMRRLAAGVVTSGTGTQAAIPGYVVGGKTGTSEKSVDGEYVGDKNLASFVGAVPLHDPELVTFIMVDEPNDGGGGGVAAPAFRDYSQKALAVLGIAPEKDVPTLQAINPEKVKHVQKAAPNLNENRFAFAYLNQ